MSYEVKWDGQTRAFETATETLRFMAEEVKSGRAYEYGSVKVSRDGQWLSPEHLGGLVVLEKIGTEAAAPKPCGCGDPDCPTNTGKPLTHIVTVWEGSKAISDHDAFGEDDLKKVLTKLRAEAADNARVRVVEVGRVVPGDEVESRWFEEEKADTVVLSVVPGEKDGPLGKLDNEEFATIDEAVGAINDAAGEPIAVADADGQYIKHASGFGVLGRVTPKK